MANLTVREYNKRKGSPRRPAMAITSLDILNLSHSLKDICEVNCNTPECLSQALKLLMQYNLIQANLQFSRQFCQAADAQACLPTAPVTRAPASPATPCAHAFVLPAAPDTHTSVFPTAPDTHASTASTDPCPQAPATPTDPCPRGLAMPDVPLPLTGLPSGSTSVTRFWRTMRNSYRDLPMSAA